jgi:hypothetical protein
MHDTAPSHTAMLTIDYLNSIFVIIAKTAYLQACSPDLNLI